MTVLRTVLREILGLFVDDVGFAAAIVGWIALTWLLCVYILPAGPLGPIVLFVGLGAILLESTARSRELR